VVRPVVIPAANRHDDVGRQTRGGHQLLKRVRRLTSALEVVPVAIFLPSPSGRAGAGAMIFDLSEIVEESPRRPFVFVSGVRLAVRI
jgi:hypothetical protein